MIGLPVVVLVVLVAAAPLVDVVDMAPGVRLDIRYATTNNFTKQAVYTEARCVLRRSVAERLARVQASLEAEGFGLKVFDCYRPLAVQRKFWALVPDPRYVADPRQGSRHNRAAAVDVTLVTAAGAEVPMPTDFDDFSERAHRDFRDLPAEVVRNRERLEKAMVRQGFVPMPTEWWHFDAPDWKRYPVADDPMPRRR
jgi:D-alanyl-D-alanine dipeptidase